MYVSGDKVLLLFQVGTGKVTSAWVGMIMAGIANGQYKYVFLGN